jgi:hypothetical protein
MKRVSRLFLSLIGLLLAGGLLLALGAYARARGTGMELVLSHAVVTTAPPFGSQVTIGNASGTLRALAAGDLDRDGDLDLVAGGLYAWENPGTGALSTTWVSATLAASVDAWDVALGDLDGDGDLDVVASGDFGLAIWPNPWNGGASSPFGSWPVSYVLTTAHPIKAIALADLDHDGWTDIAAARHDTVARTGDLYVWQSPQSLAGVWASNWLTDAEGLRTLAAGDLDHDGWVDLATGSGYLSPYAQEVRIWRNDQTPFAGTWPSNQVVELWAELGGDDANGVALADLDGDGWTDIAVGFEYATNGMMGVWRNPGMPFTGAWSISQTMPAGSRVGNVAAGDWDRDGDVDLVSVPETGGSEVLWWENDGLPFDGEWAWDRDWGSSVSAHDVLLEDLDRDGDLDTTVAGEGEIAAWPNELLPHTWPPDRGEVPVGNPDETVSAIAAGDLDWDGDLNLVSSGLYAWENPYPSTSSAPWPSATLYLGVSANDVALADLDHDGDLDAVAGGDFGVAVWPNPWDGGTGTPFGSWPVSYVLTIAQTMINEIVIADLDRDGWEDVAAVRGQMGSGGWLSIWRNPHALGGTWAANTITDSTPLLSIAAADLDHDGWIDLATGSGFDAGVLEIRAWHNDGTPFVGVWASQQVVDLYNDLGGDDVNGLSIADLDGDGWPDIAAGFEHLTNGRMGVWRNPGAPFSAKWPVSMTTSTGDRVFAVAAGDLDHDGDPDIVSVAFPGGSEVIWWENDGSPFDAPWSAVRAWPPGMGTYDLLLVDLNKNADLDAVVAGQGSPEILALLAQWQRAFLPVITRDAVSFFSGPWEGEPNDSIAQANGALNSGQDYYGYVDDADDYFSVYLRSAGHLDVGLTGSITQGVRLSLWYGSPTSEVARDGFAPYSIGYDGAAGWYYVRVYHADPPTTTVTYTLQVTYP